jgi:hypothetical protein
MVLMAIGLDLVELTLIRTVEACKRRREEREGEQERNDQELHGEDRRRVYS